MLPPGIVPPNIIQYSASRVPILQLSVGSEVMPEAQLWDYAQNFVRVQLSEEWVKGFLAEGTAVTPPPNRDRPPLRGEPVALPWIATRVQGDRDVIVIPGVIFERREGFFAVPNPAD